MENESLLKKLFTGRRGRQLREYLTAYIFIAPATILIFIFGIFPVGFALFVSLHKWRIKRTNIIGLQNYVRAIGNLAYVLVFFLGVGALVGGYFLLKRIRTMVHENDDQPWLCVLPGFVQAVVVFGLLNWFYKALPEVLDIANKLRGVERTQNVFLGLLIEALRAESVLPAWRFMLWSILGGIVASILVFRFWRNRRSFSYQSRFALVFMALGAGLGLLYYTFQQVSQAYTAAFAEGVDPGIWPQFISISGGVILLVLAWILWRSAQNQRFKGGFWLHILAALVLLVGGWLLIGEIPTIVASGDKDLWEKMRGSNIFRIIYFIPYVTPGIASAAVFQQMFSNRQSAPINMFLKILGLPPQQWLYEPRGVITMIGESLGWTVPDWASGPSLALTVIILHSIWTYVGYDTVIYLAGLGNISTEMNDQAEVDGANQWQVFRYITFPLLSPTTYFLSLIAIIGTFKAFNTIWILRSNLALGTTDTFSVTIFLEFFEKLRYGYASAMSFILFAIILALTYINNKTQGKRVFYG